MVYRQFDRTKKKRGPKQDKEPKAPKPMKRKPGKPPRGAKSQTEVIESSLFSIIRLENPEPYLFGLPGQDDEPFDDMDRPADGYRSHTMKTSDVDCSFIDKLLSVSGPEFVPLHITDQVTEMEALVNLSGL